MKQNRKNPKKINYSEMTAAATRIIHWFFSYPDKDWTFNEICKATRTSKTTARTIIENFIEQGIITRTVLGNLWRLVANVESNRFRHAKIAQNLGFIYESEIVDRLIQDFPQAKAIVLFGSFRKGEDTSGSDLDIAIEVAGDREMVMKNVGTVGLGYREKVRVNLHIFSRSRIDLNVFSSIANGIVLEGFLEVCP